MSHVCKNCQGAHPASQCPRLPSKRPPRWNQLQNFERSPRQAWGRVMKHNPSHCSGLSYSTQPLHWNLSLTLRACAAGLNRCMRYMSTKFWLISSTRDLSHLIWQLKTVPWKIYQLLQWPKSPGSHRSLPAIGYSYYTKCKHHPHSMLYGDLRPPAERGGAHWRQGDLKGNGVKKTQSTLRRPAKKATIFLLRGACQRTKNTSPYICLQL